MLRNPQTRTAFLLAGVLFALWLVLVGVASQLGLGGSGTTGLRWLLALALASAGVSAWTVLRRMTGASIAPGAPDEICAVSSDARSAADTGASLPLDRDRFAMGVFADIDRAILSRAQLDTVIGLVLRAAPQALGCDIACVAVLDKEVKNQVRAVMATGGSNQERSSYCAAFDPADVRVLARDPDGSVGEGSSIPAFLQPLVELGATRLLMLPVFVDAALAAVLAVGLNGDADPKTAMHACARDFADRLGVALTAMAREDDVQRHANYDSVTALPNQRLLRERLAQEIARAQREGREFALMYLDLDHFRKVNDSVGHLEGDTVLEQTSRRVKRCLREEDIVARFSGDEFVILLPAISSGENATRVAEKLIAVLSKPFVVAGVEHHLGASIGISVFPEDGRTADKLLRNANFAMYRAKSGGRSQCAFFDERMNGRAAERASLERDLRAAIANRELTLAYQPQFDLRDGRIVGAEALMRWNHPRLGPIPPTVFIPIAEQGNLIGALGALARDIACAQYQDWQERHLPLPRISVNVSGGEILGGGFVDQIRTLLDAQGMRPYSLELEITESLLLDASDASIGTLRSLRELGVRLAVDDFGTGYSSLAYLKNLPFDAIKIDRAFVKDLGSGDGSDGLVKAIIGVARSLGKELVAEGVESEMQRAFLMNHECEAAQGYFWSQPLPAAEFEKRIRGWVPIAQLPLSDRVLPLAATG